MPFTKVLDLRAFLWNVKRQKLWKLRRNYDEKSFRIRYFFCTRLWELFQIQNFRSTGLPRVCFDWRRFDHEIFPLPRKHALRSDHLEVQLVVLHRLQEQQIALRLEFAGVEKLPADEVAGVLQQQLQKADKWNCWLVCRGNWRRGPAEFCQRARKPIICWLCKHYHICDSRENRFALCLFSLPTGVIKLSSSNRANCKNRVIWVKI